MDDLVIIRSAVTGTTIEYNKRSGTAFSREDGACYTRDDMDFLIRRKKVTGQDITMEEHQRKVTAAQADLFLNVFGGNIIEYPCKRG